MHQCCFIFNVDDIDAMFDIDEASQASRALLAMSPSSNAVRNAQRLVARTAAQRKAVQQLRNIDWTCRSGARVAISSRDEYKRPRQCR